MDHLVTTKLDHTTWPLFVGRLVRADSAFKDVAFGHNYPKKAAEVPCIRHRLIRRTPGADGEETMRPRSRDGSILNADRTHDTYRSQWMTCIYQFDCCGESEERAQDLVREIERVLRSGNALFQRLGVRDTFFEEEMLDGLLPNTSDIFVRSLRWRVITNYTEVVQDRLIDEIRLQTMLPQTEDSETVVFTDEGHEEIARPYIAQIITVSDSQEFTEDYLPGLDYQICYDAQSAKTSIWWQPAGKKPTPGATYHVRYRYWSDFLRG